MRICTLFSGSSGNAIYIETEKNKVLIDAGLSGKRISGALEEACGVNPASLDALFVTHAHRDHVLGAGVLARRYKTPIYASEGTWAEMSAIIGEVPETQRRVMTEKSSLEIGELKVQAFPISHDALEPLGYVCSKGSQSVGIATDSGVFTNRMERELRDLSCLVLEANHDPQLLKNGTYPWPLKKRISSVLGHLSNQGAGQALLKTLGPKTKKVILAHLSAENNEPELAYQTVQGILQENQVTLEAVDIFVAPRYQPGPCIKL